MRKFKMMYYAGAAISLLSGLSLIVILWGKKVFAQNKEAFFIYGFLLLLWIFRVVVAIVYPCPPESNVWMNYGQRI